MKTFDITVIGDVSQDNFLLIDDSEATLHCRKKIEDCELCFQFGKKVPIKAIYQDFGGNAYNTAIGFSRLNLKTALLTTMGKDNPSISICQNLKKAGVNLGFIRQDLNYKVNQSNILIFHGERTILTYHQKNKYQINKFPDSDWIYLTSMAEVEEKVILAILEQVKTKSCQLIFQPGTYQLHLAENLLDQVLSLTAIFISNEAEARIITKSDSNQDLSQVLKKIADKGPKIVIATRGIQGALSLVDNNFYQISAWPNRQLVEPTGAGDAFASGFISALIYNLDPRIALRWGVVNSGSVVEAIGATANLLTRNEITQYLSDENLPSANQLS